MKSERRVFSDGQEITYTLIRKKVKNINLTVKSGGSVAVSAAPGVPEGYIDEFVQSKIPFIQKARSRKRQRADSAQQPRFLNGEQISYLGGFLTLKIGRADSRLAPKWIEASRDGSITNFSRNNQGEAVFCSSGKLYLYTADMEDSAYKQQLYETWQKIHAGILCGQISRQYYPHFQKLGIAYPQIKIRRMRSRWGSCIPKKQKITFNSRLLEKPLECIEYVVVHEFSHFVHPNHSKAFYDFVGQILPDWKERRQRLNES